ncbi:MAG: uroporphyrinogen-III synthase [Blastocatellia bacterium]
MNDADKKVPFNAHETQPLKNKTVMVTRPRAQSKEMSDMLERLGAVVIHCPAIEIIEPDNWDALDTAIEKINTYDWIIFTSANGPRFFFPRLANRRKDGIASMAELIVCAIGPATARAIESAGVRVDVTATDSKAEGALRAIIEYTGGEEKLKGQRLLIPRARIAREVLPDELVRLGAEVDTVETYQTVKPAMDAGNIVDLFARGGIDAITFTSSSTVSNFARLVGTNDLSALLQGVLIACIGPVTTGTAIEYKLEKIVQPESYTSAALVETIVRSIGDV